MSTSSVNRNYEALQAENAQLRESVQTLETSVVELQRQLDWFKRQLFGQKSEKRLDVDPAIQASLLEGLVDPTTKAETPREEIRYQRRKKSRDGAVTDQGLRFDESVPRQVVEISAPELEGPEASHFEVIGTKSIFRLAQRPGSYVVLEYRRPVVKHRETAVLKTTAAPRNVLDKSIADVSFLAGMLVDKFVWHMPLYRQHQRLASSGIQLSRTTLTDLAARSAQLLAPIAAAQLEHIVNGRVIAMDETFMKAGRQAPGKMRKGYFWPIYGEDDEVSFTFANSRGQQTVKTLLGEHFEGILLTDGYGVYERFAKEAPGLIHAQCRVGGGVATPAPHRSGRADFPHPVPHVGASLTPWRRNERCAAEAAGGAPASP